MQSEVCRLIPLTASIQINPSASTAAACDELRPRTLQLDAQLDACSVFSIYVLSRSMYSVTSGTDFYSLMWNGALEHWVIEVTSTCNPLSR